MLLAFSIPIEDKFFRPIKCERKVEGESAVRDSFSYPSLYCVYTLYINGLLQKGKC